MIALTLETGDRKIPSVLAAIEIVLSTEEAPAPATIYWIPEQYERRFSYHSPKSYTWQC